MNKNKNSTKAIMVLDKLISFTQEKTRKNDFTLKRIRYSLCDIDIAIVYEW